MAQPFAMSAEQRFKLFEDALYDAAWMHWCGDTKQAKELLFRIAARYVEDKPRVRIRAEGVTSGQKKESEVEHERGA